MLLTRPQGLFRLASLFLWLSPVLDIHVLVPMTIPLIRLSPTMCVQGDCRPLGGSTRSSSDGALNAKLASGCTSLPRLNTFIQIECGKHLRCAQWEPHPISLCSIVDTSSLFEPESPLLRLWLSPPNSLYISVHLLTAQVHIHALQGSE